MAKVTGIDLSDDRLISIASDMVDNHNYIGALKMLNKNADLWGNDEDSMMLYAEIFDDIGLYEKSINCWFKYMEFACSDDLTECYEGLASCYMNLGNEQLSAYYYNKLFIESDDLDASMNADILGDLLSSDENPLKFVYPPKLADCTENLKDGIDRMKSGDFDGAIEEFDKVSEGNPKFTLARNYVAMCKVIADRTEEAEQECLNILKLQPDNVQAMTTLAAVKTEKGDKDAAEELARRLLTLKIENDDDLYKIATVCCENKMHKEAYNLFCRLSSDLEHDLNLLFFKAVSAYNCGKIKESFATFDDLVTIYPSAVTARYYYSLAKGLEERGEREELSYFYRLPSELRESSLKLLAAFARLPRAEAKKLASEIDLSRCINWCFDECEIKNSELQNLAIHAAVNGGLDEIVRDILLDAFLSDSLKIEALTLLAERNKFDCFGVVMCNVYKRVTTMPLTVGRAKKKLFVNAYACVFAHFAFLDEDYGARLCHTAETLYCKLEREQRLSEVKDVNVLAAALYVQAKVRTLHIKGDKIYEFFGVEKEKVDALVK